MADAETLAVLKSIDQSLRTLVVIAQRKAEERVKQTQNAPAAEVAPDSDLDGKYGDPVVKSDPRDWTGESMKGRRMSECPAAYLDLLAERADYFARKNTESGELASNGQPKAKYDRLDAARARGWAARVRAGKVPTPAGADDIPDGW